MEEDQITVENGYYSISWYTSSDSRQQRVMGGYTWNNAVFNCALCCILIQQ